MNTNQLAESHASGRDLQKIGPDYRVGSVVEYQTYGGALRVVVVTRRILDLDDQGNPGFDGRVIGSDLDVWGYDDQITRVNSL